MTKKREEKKVRTFSFDKIVEKLRENWDSGKVGTLIKAAEHESGIRIGVSVLESQRTGRKYVAFVVRGVQSGRDYIILPQDVMDIVMFFRSLDEEAVRLLQDLADYVNSEYGVRRPQRVTEEEEP